ncbi:hypothetical protein HK100_004636 [Physocladia obscura]|uniref:Uncharacterized protein n=1 Tax=Physocladia obscura TaxID=109957 RepID=A0AAD5SU86_9FUNG|nr:hypothetical protein HK100_004636 [Physocladia obscura]
MNFGEHTTAAEVASAFKERILGKHFVVTGGNSGIGKETARVLANEGAVVTICCRTISKGESVKAEILKESPTSQIQIVQLDLNSLKSVRECAATIIGLKLPLNVLINNAGVMACPKFITEDGLESQFQTNHISPYYLITLLIPTLHASGTRENPSRVVNVSSAANILFAPAIGIDFDDISAAKKSYNAWSRYGQSKLALISLTSELQNQYAGKLNVAFISLHPGAIPGSELSRHMGLKNTFELALSTNYGKIKPSGVMTRKSIPEGASTTLVCALDPNVEFGKYYSDCRVSDQVHPFAFNEEFVARVKTLSEKIISEANTSGTF